MRIGARQSAGRAGPARFVCYQAILKGAIPYEIRISFLGVSAFGIGLLLNIVV